MTLTKAESTEFTDARIYSVNLNLFEEKGKIISKQAGFCKSSSYEIMYLLLYI